MNIELHPVKSSMLTAIGYDQTSSTMRVDFHGRLVDYANVSPEQYHTIVNAPSAGKAFMPIKNNPTLHPFKYV